jgi:hypothetical protein
MSDEVTPQAASEQEQEEQQGPVEITNDWTLPGDVEVWTPSMFENEYSPQGRTRVNKAKFLNCLARDGIVRTAALRAKVAFSQVYEWQRKDPVFIECVKMAEMYASQIVDEEIRNRAMDGIEQVVYDRNGNEHRFISKDKYSCILLLRQAEALNPDKWRTQRIESHEVRDYIAGIQAELKRIAGQQPAVLPSNNSEPKRLMVSDFVDAEFEVKENEDEKQKG